MRQKPGCLTAFAAAACVAGWLALPFAALEAGIASAEKRSAAPPPIGALPDDPGRIVQNPAAVAAAPLGRVYLFEPASDITAHELAQCLPLLMSKAWNNWRAIEALPPHVRRHFREHTSP